jgi:hypothetical protein
MGNDVSGHRGDSAPLVVRGLPSKIGDLVGVSLSNPQLQSPRAILPTKARIKELALTDLLAIRDRRGESLEPCFAADPSQTVSSADLVHLLMGPKRAHAVGDSIARMTPLRGELAG